MEARAPRGFFGVAAGRPPSAAPSRLGTAGDGPVAETGARLRVARSGVMVGTPGGAGEAVAEESPAAAVAGPGEGRIWTS